MTKQIGLGGNDNRKIKHYITYLQQIFDTN